MAAAALPRERILREARRLFARGRRPSVAQVAAAARISRAGFYRSFGSRSELLNAISVEPDADARQRLLEAAAEMIGAHGLGALSMDRLAERAQVSRATLYRLFPGKSALFTELVRAYSPFEKLIAYLGTVAERPPNEVIPELARRVRRLVLPRVGILRAVFFEVTGLHPDTEQAVRELALAMIGALGGYLMQQMQAGRLRKMHPLLALQSLVGPLVFHLFTLPVAERVLGFKPGEEAVEELARGWLRAMQPSGAEGG